MLFYYIVWSIKCFTITIHTYVIFMSDSLWMLKIGLCSHSHDYLDCKKKKKNYWSKPVLYQSSV